LEQPLPIGIGGVTIETTNPEANIEIFMNDLWLDYSCNAVTLFYEKDAASFDFFIQSGEGEELARIAATADDTLDNRSRVMWDKKVNAINIQSVKTNAGQSRAIIYGAVLENSASGVLYHTVGVNGAKYKHYNEADRFAKQ